MDKRGPHLHIGIIARLDATFMNLITAGPFGQRSLKLSNQPPVISAKKMYDISYIFLMLYDSWLEENKDLLLSLLL